MRESAGALRLGETIVTAETRARRAVLMTEIIAEETAGMVPAGMIGRIVIGNIETADRVVGCLDVRIFYLPPAYQIGGDWKCQAN